MTYRERREARADRLEDWAEKRAEKADAAHATASQMADAIPFGQPMLVDHYSYGRDVRYRARMHSKMDKAVEHSRKAEEMSRKASNIRAAADQAIYSDDPDAVERLTEKLASLEAARDRIKAYNASCRKGNPNPGLLDERQRQSLVSVSRAGQLKPNGSMPSYATANLGGLITTTRKRLASLST